MAAMPGYASTDLGLGDMLAGQVQGETEEERKRRLAQLQQQQKAGQPPNAAGPAATMLGMGSVLGGAGGSGRAY